MVEQVKLADLKPQHGDEPQQKERDLQGHLRNTAGRDGQGRRDEGQTVTMAAAYHAIGDDFQLKTAYDQLKAWKIFARPAGAGIPGDKTGRAVSCD